MPNRQGGSVNQALPFLVAFLIVSWVTIQRGGGVTPAPAGVVRHYVRGEVTAHFGRIRLAGVKRQRCSEYEQTGVNWRKIKAEYIAGGISQRGLAEKYGISLRTIERRAQKEKWTKKRKTADGKAVEKVAEKVAEKTAEIVADNATLCEQIKTKLLRKLAVMVDQFPDRGAGELRKKDPDGTELIYRMKDIAAVYESLSDKMPKGMTIDTEDLSPLVELLRDE